MKGKLTLTFLGVLCLTGCNGPPASDSKATASVPTPPRRSGNVIKFDPDSPQLARIRVEAAQTAEVPVGKLTAPGKVEMNPNRVSRVVLPAAGRVREVLVGLGDAVRERQPVIAIESPEVSALISSLRQSEANISQARANLAKAEADLARARDLLANRALAQKEVLAAETFVAQAKASLDQALATREETQRRLRILGLAADSMEQNIVVGAPVPGKVVEIALAPGEYRNDTSAPVMTIADLSTVWVAADVPENAIRLIRLGESVEIVLPAFPGRTFRGRVKRIADMVDPQTRTIKVRAELSNPEGQFRPEMFAQISLDQGTQALPTLPKGAVLQQEGVNLVYVELAKGQFQEVPVAIIWQGTDRVAITGIKPGARVVVDGAMLLKGAGL
jgi:membrane fusion protein, heavy metal efflux system